MRLNWAYGVTTVPGRFEELLPRTLNSLAAAGFDNPRLFIDGTHRYPADIQAGYETTHHVPPLRAFGNWVTAAWELLIREPGADRYAIFQDDLVCCQHLREYLEKLPWPEGKAYCNPYTWHVNEKAENWGKGWYPSDQWGRGAVCLIFDNPGLRALLGSPKLAMRPGDAKRGHCGIDGAIISAMTELEYIEYVHYPSLLQHTGLASAIGNQPHPPAGSFRGENFNPLDLLPCSVETK